MKSRLLPFAFFFSAMLGLAPLTNAQDSSKEAVKKKSDATEIETPEMKQIREEITRREAKQKAAVLAAVNATGPVSLPDWTPKVPHFTPSGPATRKLIDGEAKIALSGTSPLKPGEIGDAWEAAKLDRFSHSRSDDTLNDIETMVMSLSDQDDSGHELRLEATRAPNEKITHVIITFPLPVAKPADNQ